MKQVLQHAFNPCCAIALLYFIVFLSLHRTEKHRIKVERWYQIDWGSLIKESVEYQCIILKNQYQNSLFKKQVKLTHHPSYKHFSPSVQYLFLIHSEKELCKVLMSVWTESCFIFVFVSVSVSHDLDLVFCRSIQGKD